MDRRGRPRYPELLTPRETQVLDLLRKGFSNPEIAEKLGISRDGAKYHVSEILSKLGVSSREEAAAWTGGRSKWLAMLFGWPKAAAGFMASSARIAVPLGVGLLFAVAIVFTPGLRRGASEQPAETTPQAEASPAPDACTLSASICNKVAALERAILVARDFDWVVQNYAPPGFIVCNTDDPYFGSNPSQAHLCEGAGADETRFVYTIGPDRGLVSNEEYKQALRAWVEAPAATGGDQYGPADNQLYTIACQETPGKPDCADAFRVVFSKLLADGGGRSQLMLTMESVDNPQHEPTINTYIGAIPDPAMLGPALHGGEVYGFFGPQGRRTTFYSLK